MKIKIKQKIDKIKIKYIIIVLKQYNNNIYSIKILVFYKDNLHKECNSKVNTMDLLCPSFTIYLLL